VLDEAERSLHDALCVLAATVKDARVVLGGGFPEMAMARVVPARGPSRCSRMCPSFSLVTASCCGAIAVERLAMKPTLRAQAAWRCETSLKLGRYTEPGSHG